MAIQASAVWGWEWTLILSKGEGLCHVPEPPKGSWPKCQWTSVHANYAGPFMGKMFHILIDAHSKQLDIHIINSATSLSTLEKMRLTFTTHGPLPPMVTASEFTDFTKKNGIQHVTCAQYYAELNGLVERAVHT